MTTLEIILLSIIAYLLISTFLYAFLPEHKSVSDGFETLFGSVFALIILILLIIFQPISLIISRIKRKKEKKKYNKEPK